ncbi:MAG: hypothetical protein RR359_02660 [Bacilli bacterium]
MIINFKMISMNFMEKIVELLLLFDESAEDVDEFHEMITVCFNNLKENNYNMYKIILSLGIVNFCYYYDDLSKDNEEDEEETIIYNPLYECINESLDFDEVMFYIEENDCLEDIIGTFIGMEELFLSEEIELFYKHLDINKKYNPFFEIDKVIIDLELSKSIEMLNEEDFVDIYFEYLKFNFDKNVAVSKCYLILQKIKNNKNESNKYYHIMKNIIEKFYIYQKALQKLDPENIDDVDLNITKFIENNSDNLLAIIAFANKSEYVFERLLSGYFSYTTEIGIEGYEKVAEVNAKSGIKQLKLQMKKTN